MGLAASLGGCKPTESENDSGLCAWVHDGNNCYRRFIRDLDRCLGHAEGMAAPVGLLAADERSCVADCPGAASYRVVQSRRSLLEPSADAAGRDAGSVALSRDLTILQEGRTCLTLTEHNEPANHSMVATTGDATVAYHVDEQSIVIDCPDGTQQKGTIESILGCADFTGGMPGTAYDNSLGAYLMMLGMLAPLYDCRPASSDGSLGDATSAVAPGMRVCPPMDASATDTAP